MSIKTGVIFKYKNIDRNWYEENRSVGITEKKKIRCHIDAECYVISRIRSISKEGKILYKEENNSYNPFNSADFLSFWLISVNN